MSNGNTKSSKPQAVALSAQSVALFLRQNPHFLTEHEDLLTHLELAHECGEATSLIQRQTQVMRQKIEDNAQKSSDMRKVSYNCALWPNKILARKFDTFDCCVCFRRETP